MIHLSSLILEEAPESHYYCSGCVASALIALNDIDMSCIKRSHYSHVHGGRERGGEPVRLPLHLPGRHLRGLHHLRTQRRQDVVRLHQELRRRPQVGLLSRPRLVGEWGGI